jgi:hypothetical protein
MMLQSFEPPYRPIISEADRRRFLAKHANAVAVKGPLETHCLKWAYGTSSNGYGSFKLCGHSLSAHRIAWLILKGDIPLGFCVLHHCDNPWCVKVDHLFLGTSQDNTDDR